MGRRKILLEEYMKKKYIIGGVVLVGIVALCFYLLSPLHERKMTKQLFGIDEDEYKIVSRDNQLRKHKYDGSYKIVLQVQENQMESLLSEVQRAGFGLDEDMKNEYDFYCLYIKRETGLEVNDNLKLYTYTGPAKRSIFYASEPKTVGGHVIYSQCIDGYYEVYLKYVE